MLGAAIPDEGAPMRQIKPVTELLLGGGMVAAGALLAFVVPAVISAGPSRGIGYTAMIIGVLVVVGVFLAPRRPSGTKVWQNDSGPSNPVGF
jgi:hypothetical protein